MNIALVGAESQRMISITVDSKHQLKLAMSIFITRNGIEKYDLKELKKYFPST